MFVTFEGGEGAGKTAVAQLVEESLEQMGFAVTKTREPGGVPIAEALRDLILSEEGGKATKRTEALMFAAARREHLVQKILPSLRAGKIVLSDRFVDSSFVYQGDTADNLEFVEQVNQQALQMDGDDLGFPDVTFLFDLEPAEGIRRITRSHREVNRFDQKALEHHQQIRERYLALAEREKSRIVIVDASANIKAVADFIVEEIINRKGRGNRWTK